MPQSSEHFLHMKKNLKKIFVKLCVLNFDLEDKGHEMLEDVMTQMN